MNMFSFSTEKKRKFINRLAAVMCLVLVSSMLTLAQTSRGTVSGFFGFTLLKNYHMMYILYSYNNFLNKKQ